MSPPTALPCRRRRGLNLGLVSALALGAASCSTPPPQGPSASQSWEGRLALNLDTQPPEQFFAGFRLQGSARSGELELSNPLGSVLARLQWQPGSAVLRQGQQETRYASVDALLASVTGAAIPVQALFAWLDGQAAAVEGWQADLSRLGDGRLEARRHQPAPSAVLRLIFQPS